MENRQVPSRCAAAAEAEQHSSAPVDGSPPAPIPDATPGEKKRKAPAAARKPRKSQATTQIHVYYGYAEDKSYYVLRGEKLDGHAHIVTELPQPRPMSLVDLQLWIIKLFRLHPETQDLVIMGFFRECCKYSDWENRHFYTDKCWNAFANKIKRKDMRFRLYVDCSELKHYHVLLKAVSDNYSQPPTVVLPGTKTLSSREYTCPRLRIVDDLEMTTNKVAAHITLFYDKQISPPEAWRAKHKFLEENFGTFYDAHNYAPRLLKGISSKNRGSYVDIMDTEVPGCNKFRVLHHIFWAFAQCIQAFKHCRPVLCLKSTPLCGKYEGVLLTSLALDANDYPIPVAFAVVEGETKESWLWFLRNLERAVVDYQSDICIIHDYKSELVNAIDDLQMNISPGLSNVRGRRDVHSRWCIQHLAENFISYFGDKNLVMMFKRLCQQKQLSKFVKIWKELDELTSNYTAEKDGRASEEMRQESVEDDEREIESHSSQHDSREDEEEGEQDDDRNQLDSQEGDSKRNIANFSDWIRHKPLEKWSLLHDTNGARYGIMDINITDLYRHDPVLKGISCLPLSAIVEVTFRRMAEYFKSRNVAANKAFGNPSLNFPERVQDDMNSKMQKTKMHYVIRKGTLDIGGLWEEDEKFEVHSKQKNKTVIVHLISKSKRRMNEAEVCAIEKSATCSCSKPQLLHRPCSHLIAVCCHIGVSTATYMCPYYSLTNLGGTWSGKFDESKTLQKYRNTMSYELKPPTWIPDKKMECSLPVFLTSDCAGAVMEEEEQQCSSTGDKQITNEHLVEPCQA